MASTACSGRRVVGGKEVGAAMKLGRVLFEIASSNAGSKRSGTVFDAPYVPKIPLGEYSKRLSQYMGVSDEVYVIASLLITRMEGESRAMDKGVIMPLTMHRVFLTAVVIAAKTHEDVHGSTEYFAQVGGISAKELVKLEKAFLDAIKWRTFVEPGEYRQTEYSLDSLYRSLVDDARPAGRGGISGPQVSAPHSCGVVGGEATAYAARHHHNSSHNHHHTVERPHAGVRRRASSTHLRGIRRAAEQRASSLPESIVVTMGRVAAAAELGSLGVTKERSASLVSTRSS